MPEHSANAITIMKVDPILPTGITVTSTIVDVGGGLVDQQSAYHDNLW